MSVITADSGDGFIVGEDDFGDYSTAHATTSYSDDASADMQIGQIDDGGGIITVGRGVIPFTAALGAGATITAVDLSITREGGSPTATVDIMAVVCSGVTLPIGSHLDADFDAVLAGVHPVQVGRSSDWSNDATKTVAMTAGDFNPNGTTYVGLLSDDDRNSIAPGSGDDATLLLYSSESATAGFRPKVTVTYTLPGGVIKREEIMAGRMAEMNGGFR